MKCVFVPTPTSLHLLIEEDTAAMAAATPTRRGVISILDPADV